MFENIPAREQAVLASKSFKRISKTFNLSNKRVLDLGCGYGEYMQRFGPTSVGITTTPEEVVYGKKINRDIRLGNVESLTESLSPQEQFDVIWCNNILEHLLSPHSFFVHLKQFSHENTILILGTPVIPFFPTLLRIRKFSGALASPHINFFTKDTYRLTASFAGWTVTGLRPFIINNKLIDWSLSRIAPHLYLLAKNNSDYRYPPKKIHEWEHAPAYQTLLQIMDNK